TFNRWIYDVCTGARGAAARARTTLRPLDGPGLSETVALMDIADLLLASLGSGFSLEGSLRHLSVCRCGFSHIDSESSALSGVETRVLVRGERNGPAMDLATAK